MDSDELWRIEELDAKSELYGFVGDEPPRGSSAVSKAKKQFADDNDFDYNDVTGSKVARPRGNELGDVVLVVHDPMGQVKQQLP